MGRAPRLAEQKMLIAGLPLRLTAPASLAYIQVYGTTAANLSLSAITAIDQITTNGTQTGDDAYYDLTGRRVSTPAAGVYIHQGKKVVIK